MNKYALTWMLLLANPLAAQIYKYTDSDGVVHFSDNPTPGAQQIYLPAVQSYSSPDAVGKSTITTTIKQLTNYKLTIKKPLDQETIRNNQGGVEVIVQLEPGLELGIVLQLILDGVAVEDTQITPIFHLQDIPRGSHTLSVQVLDTDNQIISVSNTITVFMFRPRIRMTNAP